MPQNEFIDEFALFRSSGLNYFEELPCLPTPVQTLNMYDLLFHRFCQISFKDSSGFFFHENLAMTQLVALLLELHTFECFLYFLIRDAFAQDFLTLLLDIQRRQKHLLIIRSKYGLISLHKINHSNPDRIPLLPYSDSFKHACASQLLADVIRIQFIWRKVRIWFDTSDIPWT